MNYVLVLSVLQVIWIDILLSGDNAVVIALACQTLPERQRRTGLFLGVSFAIILRIVLAVVVTTLMGVPYLKAIGGLFILYIAVKVILGEEDENGAKKGAGGLLAAVVVIAVADVTMSLDNVVAIAGASRGVYPVFIAGLLISMPLTIVGASIMTRLMTRFPVLVWLGGGLLGWVAGDLIASDPALAPLLPESAAYVAAAIGVGIVAGVAWAIKTRPAGSVL